MSELPRALRESVTRTLYASAGAVDWENLGDREKTAQYNRWLAQPEIGGQLTRFVSKEEARVWIKDVPMKEYSRAQFGLGPFASLVGAPRCTPQTVVSAVHGDNWSVLEGSVKVKPARCTAVGPSGQSRLFWGRLADFKHLVWAALECAAANDDWPITIAVVESAARPTSPSERIRLQTIAGRCGFQVRNINPAPNAVSTSVSHSGTASYPE